MYAGGGFFLVALGFLGTPLLVRFAGAYSGSVIVSSVPSVISLSTCLFTLSFSLRGPHIGIVLLHACKICKVDKDMIRGCHKRLCIYATRWDFEPTLIWIQMDGTPPKNQMIISHQRRNVTWSDALVQNSPLFHQSTQEHEVS